jgi:hypothetical protein
MEKAFEEYIRNLVGELYPAMQVEFLPARDPVYTDPIYPVRFRTAEASVTVGFPHRIVRFPEGKQELYETVARVIRLLPYFQKTSSPPASREERSDRPVERG